MSRKGSISAGVRILEHTTDAPDRAPNSLSLIPGPLAIIGKNDTTHRPLEGFLRGPGDARRVDGLLYRWSPFRSAAPDGSRRQRIGRAGAGPQEFRDADISRGRGDTILVTDAGNSRIAWVTATKGVIRTRALNLRRPGYSFGPIAQFDHDTLIMGVASYTPQFTKPGKRNQFPVGLLTSANDSIRIILPLEGGEMVASSPALAARLRGMTTVAVRYAPNPVTTGWGTGFLAVRPDHWKLDLFQPNGKLVESVRIPVRRVAVTAQLRDRDVEGTIAAMQRRATKPIDVAAERAVHRDFPYPDSLPSFQDVKTTSGGIAWVRAVTLGGDTTWTYTAVALDGRILGRLTGTGHVPVAFGDDRVVLRDEDSDGVVTWRVMRVNWGGRGATGRQTSPAS